MYRITGRMPTLNIHSERRGGETSAYRSSGASKGTLTSSHIRLALVNATM